MFTAYDTLFLHAFLYACNTVTVNLMDIVIISIIVISTPNDIL